MLMPMLLLSGFVAVVGDASDATDGDACAFVVVSGNAATATISNVAIAFNIFVTRTYICTRTVRTVRL